MSTAPEQHEPQTTGRSVVVFGEDVRADGEAITALLRSMAAVTRIVRTSAPAQDRHGHGTHTIGTACGAAAPAQGRRYGVATEAQILAGKVLDDSGAGTDASILAGIEWAIANGCRVISMSGSLEDAQLAAVSVLPGVAAVEEQATFGLAPPDADIQ